MGNPVAWSKLLDQYKSVIPGDTIYLRGGTYTGDFTALFAGTEANPITVQPYPGERVIIDGSIGLSGANVIWQGIEFRYSGWKKRTTDTQAAADIPTTKSVQVLADGIKLLNCILHDLAGLYCYGHNGFEAHGNLMYNFGWSGPDRGHCHGIYTSNDGTTEILIKNNISFQHFSTGIKLYGTNATLDNYRVDGNTCFNNGILYTKRGNGSAGGHVWWNLLAGDVNHVGYRIQWINNLTYHSLDLHDVDGVDYSGLGTNCLSWGPYGLDRPVITGNYLAGREVNMRGDYAGKMIAPTYFRNTHVGDAPLLKAAYKTGNIWLDWPGKVNYIVVTPNDYNTKRANVTIYNWEELKTVTVDLTSVIGLSAGDQVKVHNVQDYFKDIQTLTLDADKKITVNMQVENRTVAAPYQWDAPVSTFPTFGAFVVDVV